MLPVPFGIPMSRLVFACGFDLESVMGLVSLCITQVPSPVFAYAVICQVPAAKSVNS